VPGAGEKCDRRKDTTAMPMQLTRRHPDRHNDIIEPTKVTTVEAIDSILDDIDDLLAQEDEFLTTYRQKGGQ
jgi:ubiquitin-like protein Pup